MALDFPSSPTNGQVYGNYYYNSARGAWNALLPAATPNFFTNATLNTSTLIDATATSSLISTTPLKVVGLSGQTANLQEWKDSAGVVAAVNPYGGFYTTNRLTVGASTISTEAITHINTINAGNIGLIVKGAASQTASLQQWQDSAGTVVASVNVYGAIASNFLRPTASLATSTPLIVQAAASQTADLQQWQSSTGAVLSEINSAGELQVPRIGVGSVMPTTTRLMSTASAATEVPIIARGAASQTADLQSWQNSAGTVLANVNSSGVLSLNSGGGELQIKAGAATDHAYLEFYARTAEPTTRSAYIGYPSNGSNNLTIANQIASSSIVLNSSYVTIPNQPTFFAWQQEAVGTYQTTAVTNPIFTSTLVNTGNNYSTSTGRFTAPVAGTYEFNCMLLVRSSSAAAEMTFRKNGVNVVGRNLAYSSPQGTGGHDPAHYSMFISLAAGDYVTPWISVNGGSGTDIYFGGGLGWFSGRLVG